MSQRRPILYPLIPGCCGPSREQSREHLGFRSRPVADASGAPVLRDQGPIGWPGTARPMQAPRGPAATDRSPVAPTVAHANIQKRPRTVIWWLSPGGYSRSRYELQSRTGSLTPAARRLVKICDQAPHPRTQ